MRLNPENCEIGYFRTVSRGHFWNEDIIKLEAILGNQLFDHCIEPLEPITTSEHDRFQFRDGNLFLDNIKLPIIPLRTALLKFLEFLQSSQKPVVLVSHSGELHSLLLVQSIVKAGMSTMFYGVIAGFSDSYSILRELFPYRQSSRYTLLILAKDLLRKVYNANELYRLPNNLLVIEELAMVMIKKPKLIEAGKWFQEVLMNSMENEYIVEIYRAAGSLSAAQVEEYSREMAKARQLRSTLTEDFSQAGPSTSRALYFPRNQENQPYVTIPRSVAHIIVSSGGDQNPHCDRVDPILRQENEFNFPIDWLEEGQDSVDESLDQDSSQPLVDQNRLDQNQLDENQHDQEWIQAFIQSTDILDY